MSNGDFWIMAIVRSNLAIFDFYGHFHPSSERKDRGFWPIVAHGGEQDSYERFPFALLKWPMPY